MRLRSQGEVSLGMEVEVEVEEAEEAAGVAGVVVVVAVDVVGEEEVEVNVSLHVHVPLCTFLSAAVFMNIHIYHGNLLLRLLTTSTLLEDLRLDKDLPTLPQSLNENLAHASSRRQHTSNTS